MATAALGFSLACAGPTAVADPGAADGDVSGAAGEFITLAQDLVAPEEPAAPSGVIYVTLRRDLRRCAAPLCGGFFVKRVNRLATLCADGTRSAECYVAELAFDALGLSEEQATVVRSSAEDAVLRGSIGSFSSQFGELGRLDVTEVWLGHSGVETRASTTSRSRQSLPHEPAARAGCPSARRECSVHFLPRRTAVAPMRRALARPAPRPASRSLIRSAAAMVKRTVTPVLPIPPG